MASNKLELRYPWQINEELKKVTHEKLMNSYFTPLGREDGRG